MKTIGICIPTYQRGEITKQSILNIYNKNKQLFDSGICHFYISDDCSKDNTFEILSELNKDLKFMTIKKTEKNLGFEGNNGRCILMCEKDYAWMLGDDDTIDVDINEVINRIEESKIDPDFVVIGKYDDVKEKIYTDKVEAIEELLYESTWMSGLIYKTSIASKLDFCRYSEGEFPQTGAIFEYFGTNDSSIQYIYGPDWARIMRPGVISYSERVLDIYARGWTDLVMGLPLVWTYKEKLKLLSLRSKRGRDMMSNMILMSLRARNGFDSALLKEYYPYIKLYNKSPYFVLHLISIMPKSILSFARKKYAQKHNITLIEQG
mgnify:FL=1